MERRCKEVVDEFQKRGHTCHVLTSRYGLQSPLQEEGVTRSLYLQSDVSYYRPLDFFLRRPWQEWANQYALRHTLDVFQPDLIFVWGMWNLSQRVAYWAEQWLPERVAYNLGGYWPTDIDPHRAYWGTSYKNPVAQILLWPFSQLALAVLKLEQYPPRLRFSHVSCCSQYVVDVLTDSGAIPSGAVAILNGINPVPFITHARQGAGKGQVLRLIYFGGLMEHKGVHTAIEALDILRSRGQVDTFRLTIVGSGHPDYEAYLHTLTKSLALEDRITFVSSVRRSAIPKILEDHDVFLFTSIYAEPFGRTIIEAMAAGLAVVGSNVGGSREIFEFYPEDTLFEPGNAEELADQIQRLIGTPKLVQRLGKIGQKVVLEHFTLQRMVDEMESWLKEVAG